MEIRIESMICAWDDTIPAIFIESVNFLTLTTDEEGLRKSAKEFAEKYELDESFLYGFGSHVVNIISICINTTQATPKR